MSTNSMPRLLCHVGDGGNGGRADARGNRRVRGVCRRGVGLAASEGGEDAVEEGNDTGSRRDGRGAGRQRANASAHTSTAQRRYGARRRPLLHGAIGKGGTPWCCGEATEAEHVGISRVLHYLAEHGGGLFIRRSGVQMAL